MMRTVRAICAACCMILAAGTLSAAGKKSKKADAKPQPAPDTLKIEKKAVTSVKCESGNIRLILRSTLGTFQVYAVRRDGNAVPVFADYDESMSTYFSLLAGKTEYKLNETTGILTSVEKTDGGSRIVYTVPGVADTAVDFLFMKTNPDSDDDMLKVAVSVTNKGPRTDVFAVKGVFDTVLGEKTGNHFSTAQSASVNTEVQYRSMKDQKWILSEGDGYGVQLLLWGGDITAPGVVTLGNKDIMTLPLWIPAATTMRSFDNVMSYNNSAVSVNWDSAELKPQQSYTDIFYLVLGSDGNMPAGAAYLASLAGESSGADDVPAAAAEQPVPAAAALAAPVPAAQAAAVPADKPKADVPFDVITEEKLDPEYIRTLINRINALEDDDKTVNRNELLRLNAELDAILEKLRQR